MKILSYFCASHILKHSIYIKMEAICNLILASVAATCPAFSAGADNLVVTGTNGVQTKVAIPDISRITFDGDNMKILTTTDGEQIFAIVDLDNMKFDVVSSSIDDITADLGDDISIASSGGVMTISSGAGASVNVVVFSINGSLVTMQSGVGRVSIDFNTVTPGVYIVKANNKTIKFIR